jgi:hypothetical protein
VARLLCFPCSVGLEPAKRPSRFLPADVPPQTQPLDLPIIFYNLNEHRGRDASIVRPCIVYSEAPQNMNDVRNRYILLVLVIGGTCLLMYLVGIFYQKFLNNPYDLVALIFIVAFYVATLYFHLQRPGGQN